MLTFLAPAVWGFLGAFLYAAPRLMICVSSARAEGKGYGLCLVEAALALIVGAIAASALGPSIEARVGPKDISAVCAMVGLLANPLSPRIIEVLGGRLITMLKGGKE